MLYITSLTLYTFLFVFGVLVAMGLIIFFGNIYERYKNKRKYRLHRIRKQRPIICGLRNRANIGG